jgi:Flp pilus assembly pilin Flp
VHVSDLIGLIRAAGTREEGQTMAEYGVTMAVITVALLAVFTALSGGISGAVNRAISLLPS